MSADNKKAVEEIYSALCEQFQPEDNYECILLDRAAVLLWKVQKTTEITSIFFFNEQKRNEEFIPLVSLGSMPITTLPGYEETLQRYELNAENSFYKAINALFRYRKNKMGSFLQNT